MSLPLSAIITIVSQVGKRTIHHKSSKNMTILKTRSRMVSVRLSENEYQALLQRCSSSGARSVSDLTRSAMHALLNGTTREEMLHIRMNEFCDQMNSLGRRIEELVEKVAASERVS